MTWLWIGLGVLGLVALLIVLSACYMAGTIDQAIEDAGGERQS